MKNKIRNKIICLIVIGVLMISGCQNSMPDEKMTSKAEMESHKAETEMKEIDEDLKRGQIVIKSLEDIDEAIQQMTLEEKAGQLIQAERGGIKLSQVSKYNIGAILSGGGSVPSDNNPTGWVTLYNNFQEASRSSSSGIPVIYGIDAVHGNNNVDNVTIFPHNIGLGAANNEELMEAVGRATSREVQATGVNWNFAPAVSCVQDLRWGRSYESYSENIDRVAKLAASYIIGLQDEGTIATTKHFIGDGQTTIGTGDGDFLIDRGDVTVSVDELRRVNLKAYEAAIEAGTKAIMASFNSVNGTKVHGDQSLLIDLLRDELGFEGLVVSDWEAIHAIAPTLKEQVALSINSGVDLLMQPYNWKEVYGMIVKNVQDGLISEERLNEAVKRNLVFKFEAGLFVDDYEKTAGEVGTKEHRALAREAVAQSMVLLQNNGVLPLEKDAKVFVMGPASDHVGIQCGGWTREWQGSMKANLNNGTSLKDAFEIVLSENGGMIVEDPSEADVIILAIGEKPYAEMKGDTSDLSLSGITSLEENLDAVNEASSYGIPVVTVMIAGRPMIINDYLNDWDAFCMAWLPGTEGLGMTDVLFGDKNFTGSLPITWPKTNEQASDSIMMEGYNALDYQFEYDFGLNYK